MNWILEIVTQLSYSSTLSSVCYQIDRLNGLLVAMGEGPGNCIVWGWLTEGGGVWLSLTGLFYSYGLPSWHWQRDIMGHSFSSGFKFALG